MNYSTSKTLMLVTLVLFAGCAGGSTSKTGLIQAKVVESPPENATVIDVNSSSLDDKPRIREAVKQAVQNYEDSGPRDKGVVQLNSSEYPESKKNYESLETRYIEYRDYITKLTFATEHEQ
jgi:hypothetical protein